MGWKLLSNGPTDYLLVKVDPASTMLDTPLSTNLSAADIVKHCYDIGLVQRSFQARINAPAGGVTMAFAAQPSVPKIPIVVREDRTVGAFTDEHGYFDEVSISSSENCYLLTHQR